MNELVKYIKDNIENIDNEDLKVVELRELDPNNKILKHVMTRIELNIRKMLKRRGYTVYNREESEDYELVIPFFGGCSGKVFYCNKDKFGQEDLVNVFRPFINQDFHVIVIYKEISSHALNSFKASISKYMINSELIDHFLFFQDVMSHPFIPKYEKMTHEEKNYVLDLYKTPEHKFPQMLISDPVSIIMGFKHGEMIRIKNYYNFTRKCVDKSMPPAITYCMVTNKME